MATLWPRRTWSAGLRFPWSVGRCVNFQSLPSRVTPPPRLSHRWRRSSSLRSHNSPQHGPVRRRGLGKRDRRILEGVAELAEIWIASRPMCEATTFAPALLRGFAILASAFWRMRVYSPANFPVAIRRRCNETVRVVDRRSCRRLGRLWRGLEPRRLRD